MVAGATRRLAKVPKFASLRDFLLAKKWYMRAVYMPGPERHDLEARMRRHPNINPVSPYSRLPLSARRHEAQKAHISFTSARH